MIQRGIGATIGAIVTLVLLLILGPSGASVEEYITPLVIGAVVTFVWPILIVFWLGRRAKAKHKANIDEEVSRQLHEQSKE